jgi:hypothetical protein
MQRLYITEEKNIGIDRFIRRKIIRFFRRFYIYRYSRGTLN